MLDQQQADALFVADVAQQLVQLGGLARVEAGSGLVEAQQQGVVAHAAGDFELALGAIGQVTGLPVGHVQQLHLVQPLARLVDGAPLGAAVARQTQEPGDGKRRRPHEGIVLRHDEVFQYGHAPEQPDVLKRPRHVAALGDAEPLHAFQQHRAAGMVQGDPSHGRLVETRQAVEHRGLAGAVGADDGGNFPFSGRERKIVDGHDAAEAHGHVLNGQQRAVVLRGAVHRPCHVAPSPLP